VNRGFTASVFARIVMSSTALAFVAFSSPAWLQAVWRA